MSTSSALALDHGSARALELDVVLELLAGLAATDLARQRLRELRPTDDLETIEVRRERIQEVSRWLATRGNIVASLESSVGELVRAVADPRGWLEPQDLLQLAGLLRTIHQFAVTVLAAANSAPDTNADPALELAAPALAQLVSSALDDMALDALSLLVASVARILDAKGEIRPDASPRLVTLRAQVRGHRDRLQRAFEEYAENHRDDLGEDTVSFRDGRFSLLLPTGHKGRLTGVTHARSATGRSYHFEPLELIEDNNELELARAEESAERQRLLAELESSVRSHRREVLAALSLLVELDVLQAIAVYARLARARFVPLTDQGTRLVSARHPLLEPSLAALREQAVGTAGNRGTVVPLDLDFEDNRVIVVTGPNAGGKTVALKTLGLLTVMAHCGLPIPAQDGTRIGAIQQLVAVIGDEQSLLADRSTFSGQLLRWKAAWEAAGPSSLILIDELGSGTNPQEGGALGLSLLESLCERGAWALLTTHLVEIAAATYELPAARALAMEFDTDSALPTFRLRPTGLGGSEALALARRLGLPAAWIDRAEQRLGPEQRELRRLLEEADRHRHEAAAERDQAESDRRQSQEVRRALETELAAARQERLQLRRQVERELTTFRKDAALRLEREIRGLSSSLTEATSPRASRKLAERTLGRVLEAAPTPPVEPERESEAAATLALTTGSQVVHRALGWSGRLQQVDGARAEVTVGGKRVRCNLDELRPAGKQDQRKEKPPVVRLPATPEISTQLDLIGQRVAPALATLDDYLDQALRASAERLRIIHGHGSGALRRAVREHLHGHPAVASVAPAGEGEGGDGATIATLRGAG